MIPSAPVLETAEASWDLAIQPIGACTIGMSTPRARVTRLLKRIRWSSLEGQGLSAHPGVLDPSDLGPPRRRRLDLGSTGVALRFGKMSLLPKFECPPS